MILKYIFIHKDNTVRIDGIKKMLELKFVDNKIIFDNNELFYNIKKDNNVFFEYFYKKNEKQIR